MLKIVCSEKSEVVTYPLLVDKKYIIGRKQGDITFHDDSSISRVHAEIVVDHDGGNMGSPFLTPSLVISDLGSKFGTYITEHSIKNKIKANKKERITVAVGDKFRFGCQWNTFRVMYTPLVLTSSSVKVSQEFKDKILKLGGHFVNEWSVHVTHVVMDSLTLTIKAVCALLAGKHIVTQAYVTDLLSSFEIYKSQPDPKNFLPPVAEREFTSVNETVFHPNDARSALFAGKTFLFCTQKHFKKLGQAVEAGGGIAKLAASVIGQNIHDSQHIMMGHPLDIASGEKDSNAKIVIDNYRQSGKRFIADSEIGLAAVYNSIEKHCNPDYNMKGAVLPPLATQTQHSDATSIVPETQPVESQRSSVGNASRRVVNETLGETSFLSMSRGEKRSGTSIGVSESATKKRYAAESLAGPNSKRLKEIPVATKTSSRITRSSQSSRTLTSLFNMGDSSDDEDLVVPESPPQRNTMVDDDLGVIPESQPLVTVVDVRNLQSASSTQESNTTMGRDEETFRIPAVTQTLPRNNYIGTDNVNTVTESVMNARTIPVSNSFASFAETQPTPPSSSSKKNIRQTRARQGTDDEGETSRKRRREDNETDLAEQAKKLNLNEVKIKVKTEDGETTLPVAPNLALIVKPLVNKNMLRRESSFTDLNDSNHGKKNFKTFKKVLPSFVNNGGSKNSTRPRNLNESIESIRNTKTVKLTAFDYFPGPTVSYPVNAPSPQESRQKPPPRQNNEVDCPPEFVEFERELFGETSNLTKSSKRKEPAPAQPTARRKSPRKKAPNNDQMPPPPAPAPVPMMEVEDDDDMWSFGGQ